MVRHAALANFQLPLLEPHDASLQKCVYCPKLSRAACPISNVEANETVTPWGKMSMAFFAARGDVPIDRVHADPAWACSACYACRERCDHRNEVATVLTDARADLFARGVAPAGAQKVASRWPAKAAEAARSTRELSGETPGAGAVAVLIGCGYIRRAPEVARDALRATAALVGGRVRAVEACCGLPWLYAGDREAFAAAARRLQAEVSSAPRLVAVDPGCARAVLVEYRRLGVPVIEPELFVDVALAQAGRLRRLGAGATGSAEVRYHDPCQLGRGLGRFDPPRELIERITGAAPREFLYRREHAVCSGAGGILPATRPETSRTMADERIAEHRARGGGTLVTACAGSLHRFRSRGEPAADLVTLVSRALEV